MFAVVESGGKQYRVKSGSVVKVEKMYSEPREVVQLGEVMAVGTKIGQPYLDGAKVMAEVIAHDKTDKVIVFKKKRRHNYRRKRGHRQQITVLRVKEIIVSIVKYIEVIVWQPRKPVVVQEMVETQPDAG